MAIKELIKSLKNIKGDFALNYKTVAVVYGEFATKLMITILILINCIVSSILIFYFDLKLMYSFFVGASLYLIVLLFFVWKVTRQKDYNLIDNLIKFLILIGVLSIILLDPQLILSKLL